MYLLLYFLFLLSREHLLIFQKQTVQSVINFQAMSIYSGFPTRKDQNNYNKLLTRLLIGLQDHLLTLVQTHNIKIPQDKANQYYRVLTKMKEYQQHKYLPPKFSELLQPLHQALMTQKYSTEQVVSNKQQQSHLPQSKMTSRMQLAQLNDITQNKQIKQMMKKQTHVSVEWRKRMKRNSSLRRGSKLQLIGSPSAADNSNPNNFAIPNSNHKRTSHSFLSKNMMAVSFNQDIHFKDTKKMNHQLSLIGSKGQRKYKKPKTEQSYNES